MNGVTPQSLITLAHLGLLHVTGEGAQKLLQGQLTCNMDDISPTQSRLGAHCNPQGRILSLFRIFTYGEGYYLQMPKEVLSSSVEALQKYAVFFKANLQDATNTFKRICYKGDQLQTIFPVLPQKVDEVIAQDDLLIIKLTGSRYEIIGNTLPLAEIETQLGAHSEPDSLNAWKAANIANGIPSVYKETIGKFLPHEINLPVLNAVSFEKGCYTGQEIIARMHYRGQLKKAMCRARIATTKLPEPGSDIFENSPCGIIVDSCREDEKYCQILVVVDQALTESQKLFLDSEKTEPLEFLALPSGPIYA